ncbi:interferon alpha-like [Tachysurus fulvidraco]|uniref:interferon alpha-like n=1 Tax=Tachysurus fulvidraco TaxID=1234273 RepID=UPI001FEFE2A6|nr:interferon alpha-like [Tachysurus fulvidraco]
MELLRFVFVLVLSVCEAAAVPPCKWADFRLQMLNKDSITLLESMGGPMPLDCLEEKNNSFPQVSFPKDENLLPVALETLNEVAKIFNMTSITSVTWDRGQLRYFKALIDRQVENLKICVGKQVQTVMDKSVSNSTDTLRSYFVKLEERLKEKEFSSCAWEIVRKELLDSLQKLQTFIKSKN